jgi:hypothetical protein
MKKEKQLPNPGSKQAVALGCTCPISDNNHGEGFPGFLSDVFGGACFVMNGDCPVHSEKKKCKK